MIPWRRKWQPAPVFLPGKSHGQRSLAGCSPWGHKSRTRLSNSTTTAVLLLEKNPCKSGPMQFKSVLFKSQLFHQAGVLVMSVFFRVDRRIKHAFQRPPRQWFLVAGYGSLVPSDFLNLGGDGHQQRQALNQFTYMVQVSNDSLFCHLRCWKQYRSKHVPASQSPRKLNRKKIPGPHSRSAKSEPPGLRTKESAF